jgi:hypothetical protein
MAPSQRTRSVRQDALWWARGPCSPGIPCMPYGFAMSLRHGQPSQPHATRGMLKACIASAGYTAGRIGRDAGAAASSQCWGRDPSETLLAMVPSCVLHF